MQPSRHPCLIGVAAVLLCVTVTHVAANQYYVATDLDDPLQPVWDTLDRLPQEVSDAVIRAVRTLFTRLNTQLENKVQPITFAVGDLTTSLNRLTQLVSGGVSTNNNGSAISQFYERRFVNDLEEAVTKIERHIDSRVEALEAKLITHINLKLTPAAAAGAGASGGGNSGSQDAFLTQTLNSNTVMLENINTHVLKINEKIGDSPEGGDSCNTLVDKVSELMGNSAGSREVCPDVSRETLVPLGLPRDCSDKHWQEPELPSGVYETFPTLDHKAPVNSYCDMGERGAKDTGGWTVILRRRNTTFGLVNFNRTWSEYRMGFGDPGEGEWWFGLSSLHALTYRQPFEVDLILNDIQRGTYHAQYTTFRVEDEANKYRLVLGGFSGNLTHDALTSKHHGSPFTTWDRDNDAWGSGNCGQSNGGGWWFDNCHFTTLTAPFPTSMDRNARTIRWLEEEWLVLDDVTMKIRPFNYAERFSTQTLG